MGGASALCQIMLLLYIVYTVFSFKFIKVFCHDRVSLQLRQKI